jgi:5-(carboxyamino)imidazole ribonucleotide mutase
LAVGKAGAINAALLAAAILGGKHPEIREAYRKYRDAQTQRVLANPDPKAAARAMGIGAKIASAKKGTRA